MQNPVLYASGSMTVAQVLHPLKLKLTLKCAPEGFSSASMTLPKEESGIGVGRWVGIVPPNGTASDLTVFYVRSESTDMITGLQTLELEHAFGLLEGMVAFGEFDANAMGGSSGKVAIATAIRFMLSKQPSDHTYWRMLTSDCDFSDEQGWKVSNEDLSSAITGFTDAVQDCQFEFDMATLPWKMKLKAWPTTPSIEMRLSRNIETLSIKRDSSKMYTRCYPTGKNGINIKSVNSDVPYLDRNTATYGIIAEVITDSTVKDATLLKAWAQKQLKRNSTPYTSISVGAMELSNITGLDWDRFRIGKLCRIALPVSNEVIQERIVELSWSDCIADETKVTVTMGQAQKTIADVLNENSKGGGAGSKKNNDDKDNQFGEDGEKIETFENSDIWINKDSIWNVCGCYTVTTDSEGKHLKVNSGTALEIVREGATLGVYDSGNLTAGVIVNKINGGTATITANHVILSGTSTSIQTKITSIDSDITSIIDGTTLCSQLRAAVCIVNGKNMASAPFSFGTAYESQGRIYIPYTGFNGTIYNTINFSIADTSQCQSLVSAKWTAAFNKVELFAEGVTLPKTLLTLKTPSASMDGQTTTTYTLATKVDGTQTYVVLQNGSSVCGGYDITSLISGGSQETWETALQGSAITAGSADTFTVTMPALDGTAHTIGHFETYTVDLDIVGSASAATVKAKIGDSYYASINVGGLYDGGWDLAANSTNTKLVASGDSITWTKPVGGSTGTKVENSYTLVEDKNNKKVTLTLYDTTAEVSTAETYLKGWRESRNKVDVVARTSSLNAGAYVKYANYAGDGQATYCSVIMSTSGSGSNTVVELNSNAGGSETEVAELSIGSLYTSGKQAGWNNACNVVSKQKKSDYLYWVYAPVNGGSTSAVKYKFSSASPITVE